MLKGLVSIFAALLADLDTSKLGQSTASPFNYFDRIGPILFVTFSMVITFLHIYLLRKWHPTCSVTFVTRARSRLLCIALYGQVCLASH